MSNHMYFRRLTPVLVVLAMATVTAFAKNSRTFKLNSPASLGGTQLSPGNYKVEWESHSPEATVTLRQGKSVVATVKGRWVERGAKYPADSVLYQTNADGSRSIMEIRFAGMSQALVFGEPASA